VENIESIQCARGEQRFAEINNPAESQILVIWLVMWLLRCWDSCQNPQHHHRNCCNGGVQNVAGRLSYTYQISMRSCAQCGRLAYLYTKYWEFGIIWSLLI